MRKYQLLKNVLVQATVAYQGEHINEDMFLKACSAVAGMAEQGSNPGWSWMGAVSGINDSNRTSKWESFTSHATRNADKGVVIAARLSAMIFDSGLIYIINDIVDSFVAANSSLEGLYYCNSDTDDPRLPRQLNGVGIELEGYRYNSSDDDDDDCYDDDDDDCDDDDCDDERDTEEYIHGRMDYNTRLKFRIPLLEKEGKSLSSYSSDKRLFFGIELECEWDEDRSHSDEIKELQIKHGSKSPYVDATRRYDEGTWVDTDGFICKYDSSIGDDYHEGTEVVFQPRCLEEAKDYFSPIINYIKSRGARSYDTNGRCGIHMHVGKARVSSKAATNVAQFLLDYQNLCEKIAQRKSTDYARYDRLTAGCEPPHIHCSAINQTNETWEMRIFKGTLSASTFLSYIQFATILYNLGENGRIGINDFVKEAMKMPELSKRLTKIMKKNGMGHLMTAEMRIMMAGPEEEQA